MFITCFLLTVYVQQTLVLYLLYRLFTNSIAKIYSIFILYIFNDCTMSRKTFGISLFAVCILCSCHFQLYRWVLVYCAYSSFVIGPTFGDRFMVVLCTASRKGLLCVTNEVICSFFVWSRAQAAVLCRDVTNKQMSSCRDHRVHSGSG